jgi:hypothetical protein
VQNHIHAIQIELEHLCETCQFTHKCVRFHNIHDRLLQVESDALNDWRMDVDVEFSIKKCDLYTADKEKVSEFVEHYFDSVMDEADYYDDDEG